jgi:hypothetical protein
MTWYEPEDPTPREACPCCGYVTLAERGMCHICRVCFWEDDPFVRDAHHVYSTPNHMTLAEARRSFATIGASKAEWLGHVLPFAALTHIERRPVELTDPFPPREQCPCCGYISIPALREQWECAVCQWQDDGEPLDVAHTPDRTLWMARARFARSGITDERFERRPLAPIDVSLPTYPCQCCDHVTLVERGTESLCPLCYWIDDAVATARDVYSVPNACTLADARARFAGGQRVVDEELVGRVDREDCALFEHRPIP